MNKDLTVGSPGKSLIMFTIPLFISVMFQQMYNIADSVIAGKFAGEDALAAIGASYPITMIFMAVAVGCQIGCSVVISKHFGAGNMPMTKTCISTALISGTVLSAVLTVVGVLFSGVFMQWVQTPDNIFDDGCLYLMIYTGGFVFLFIYNVVTGIFNSLGDSKSPLFLRIGCSIGIVFLDCFFIIRFQMRVAVAACATFIAQGAACLLALFLLLRAAFLKGVDDYQELLRCSVAFAGNDHRLGAQEAPPAIISVFLGTDLEGIIDAIVGDNNYTAPEHKSLRIGVDVLPSIPQDTTDRNRPSPVAFTGNTFENRLPGSSQSIAGPITILNAIMADELDQFYETLKDASDFTAALHKLIRDTFSAHRRIIFNGNGYEDAWIREAEKRGLANLRNTAEALPTYLQPKNIEMLTRQGVYSREEILSRHEVHIEKYCKVIRIEAGTLVDMVQHGILNAVSEYEATLCNTIVAKHTAAPELTCHVESSLANAIGSLNEQLLEETIGLKTALETVSESFSPEQLLHYYHDEVEKRMDDVRRIIDKLEVLTASKYWPYPTFCELLFSV